MIRTVIIPENSNYKLDIPPNYIGKKVEVLLYALDEVAEEENNVSKKTMSNFCGILSENDYLALKKSTEQSRKEWNRNI